MTKAIQVASIPTKGYKEVIEVKVPIRFYWSKDGEFDGIEFGPFRGNLLPWEGDMITQCLEAVSARMEGENEYAAR